MPNYDEHPMIQRLRQNPRYERAEDPVGLFKRDFWTKGADARLADLANLDQWLAQESRISHEHAELINIRRELRGIHENMHRAGR
jgi:hypothetical protein